MTRRKTKTSPKPPKPERPVRLLLVDPDPQLTDLIQNSLGEQKTFALHHVTTLAEARKHLGRAATDVAVIREKLPDGSGFDLAGELSQGDKPVRAIMLSDQPSLDMAIAAIRAGASDPIVNPLDLNEINQRVHSVFQKSRKDRKQDAQLRRLRRTCRQLNNARTQVTSQVDTLCNDLVTAYQELAQQVQHVMYTSAYDAILRDELDFEQLLRKTLEFVVEKVGPTNAAMFLPSTHDEFSVGGYVQHDLPPAATTLLLDELADTLAPAVATHSDVLYAVDDESRTACFGEAALYLGHQHAIAFSCRHDEETLAVALLFRSEEEPFDESALDCAAAIAPMIGERLARIIRVHHRTTMDFFEN